MLARKGAPSGQPPGVTEVSESRGGSLATARGSSTLASARDEQQELAMRAIKNFVFGIVVGLVLGLWFGVNIGKDKPIFSNPLEEPSVQEKMKQSGQDLLQKGGEALKKGGEALEKEGKALQGTIQE